MMMTIFKKTFVLLLCIVTVAAMSLSLSGCNQAEQEKPLETVGDVAIQKSLGTGNTKFDFTVVFRDGSQMEYLISTNEATVGKALQQVGIVDADDGADGMYVTVAGQTLDYNKDGYYWAFYENDEYAMTGVNDTAILDNKKYSFKAQK